jgi:hypothetical protein
VRVRIVALYRDLIALRLAPDARGLRGNSLASLS